MAVRSRFTPRVPQAPTGRKLSVQVVKDMRGLNATDPYGILKESASPYLRNARMYLKETERQVAISTRTGAGFYSIPIGETNRAEETSTTGAATINFSKTLWVAQKFTPSVNGNLTMIEINIATDTGSGPVAVTIHSDDSNKPGTQLAESSIFNSDVDDTAAYVQARFVEAPALVSTNDYWVVFKVREGDTTEYAITTTTNGTAASSTTNGGTNWTTISANLNYKVYLSTAGGVLGSFRYYPQSAQNLTVFAHNTDIYSIDDSNGTTTSRKSGLNASATNYRFAQFDDAIFVANGYDSLQRSTGGAFANVTQAPSVPSHVVDHKNRLFIVSASDKNRLEFCELADYTDWESTGFIYVPSPKSSDPITGLVSFQDQLVIFTKHNKYVLYGDDLATFQIRQSLGQKGAVSQEAICADENYVYFVHDDGHMYRWNGSRDEQLSRVIESNLDDVANFNNVRLTYNDDKIYYWFQSTGSTDYDRNFVYEIRYQEWFYDTGRHVNGATILKQEAENMYLTSSRVGALYNTDECYCDLGKPIEFEYHTNYYDFGYPDNLKQIRRLYLQFRKTSWAGEITVGTDVDFKNDPVTQDIAVQQAGYLWNDGLIEWGDPEIFWGNNDQYLRHRMTVPGQGTHYQIRVKKTGAGTPLYFIGYSTHYRNRRAA
jgi:hypothetical protein